MIRKFVQNSFIPDLLPVSVPWKPLKLVVGITNACNLKCTMCWRAVNKPHNEHMSQEIFERILDIKPKSIAFMGEGESLLHPNLDDFLMRCIARNIGVYLTINGMIFNSTLILPCVKEILFSIDGVGDNYEKIRVGANFNTVIDNLKWVRYYAFKGKVTVNFVGMKFNIEDLPKLIEMVGKHVDAINVQHLVTHTQSDEHLNQNKELAERVFKESRGVADRLHVKLNLRPLVPYESKCVIPWFAPYIGITGNVYPCCFIGMNDGQEYASYKVKFKVNDYLMGNIMDSSFKEIWNGELFKCFRKELKWINSKHDSPMFCRVCPIRWNCAC